ncbi:hypothetical protein BH20ACI3_BH20ACI3_38110 [soil metagenome]
MAAILLTAIRTTTVEGNNMGIKKHFLWQVVRTLALVLVLSAGAVESIWHVEAAGLPESMLVRSNDSCAKQRAVMRQLERMPPGKKVSRKQILNRIKAACGRMRDLNCPELQNFRPSICFTDF